MKRKLLNLLVLLLFVSAVKAQNKFYLRSSAGEPWLNNSNVTLMNQAFGSTGWILGVFQTTSAATVFNATTRVVFLDGSNMGATALNSYLTTNRSTIENWVSNGGMLFLNAAPDQGSNINLGFGGVTLNFNINYNKSSNSGAISSGQNSHPIFLGPNSCGSSWTGQSLAQATITGTGVTPLITSTKGTILAEKLNGYGRVIFGTMTLAAFHSPQPQGNNLRLNILSYLDTNAPFVISCNASNASCIGTNNGASNVSILAGGVAPLTYLWSNGSSSASLLNLSPATYTVTVTDVNGVSRTCSSNVGVNPAPSITASGPTTICNGDSVMLTSSAGTSYLWSSGLTSQTIAAKSAGNYNVQVNSSGCIQTSTPVTVSIFSDPTISLNGPSTICPGSTVILTASTSNTYLWSNGITSQSISTSLAGTYTCTVTNSSGCTQTVSQTILVQAMASPVISAVGGSVLCPGNTVTLSTSIANSYLWSNGVTTQSAVVSNSGNYTVRVSDALNCSATSTAFNVGTPVGNPLVFGTNIWNVYAFNTGGAQYNPNAWSIGYSGFYTDNTLSFNTQSRWPLSGSPSNASGYQGCTVNHENHGWSAKRQGFPCGYYQIDIPDHDAVIELLINDVQVWQHTGSGVSHTNVWSGYLSNTSKIELRGSDGTGNSYGSLVLTKATSNILLINSSWFLNSNLTSTTLCTGQSTVLSAPAGVASYLWSTGSTNASITVTASGATTTSYTVTVTDQGGCTTISSPFAVTSVAAAAPAPVINASPGSTICQDQTTILSTSISYSTYLWSNNITSSTTTVNQSGNYTILVSTANGCKATASRNITVIPKPTPIISATSTQICAGSSTTLNAGTFVTYLWSNSSTLQNLTTSAAGTYTVTVTVTGGCSGTGTIVITQRANPVVTATATPTSIFTGNTSQFNALPLKATGSSYLTNVIAFAPIAGSGNAVVLADEELSVAQPIGFNFNFYGNTYSQFYISSNGFITFDPLAGDGCCIGQMLPNFSKPSNIIAGAWSDLDPSAGGTIEYFTIGSAPNKTLVVNYTNIANFGGGQPETFQILLKENSSKIEIHTTQVSPNIAYRTSGIENSLGNDATVIPGRNGSNTWGAANDAWEFSLIPNNSFVWTPSTGLSSTSISNPIASPGTSTNYTVTVTDFYGCTGIASLGLVVSPTVNPTINGNAPFCQGDSIQLSVASGYLSYLWSNGNTNSSISVSTAGTYTITVGNLNGSTGVASAVVIVNPKPAVSITGSSIICQNSAIHFNTNGSYSSYLWSNGATIDSIQVSASGTYIVTVTNANGCTNSASKSASISASPIPTITGVLTFCQGTTTTLNSNSFPSYLWSTGASSQAISIASGGDYAVTVFDENGCSGSSTINVNSPVVVSSTPSGTTPSCFGISNGTASVLPSGGISPYSFLWSNGVTNTTINNIAAGTYSITVTDDIGCTGTSSITISQPSILNIAESNTNVSCNGGNNGSVTLVITGGTGPYNYLWNTGSTLSTINNLTAGNYTVTVSDSKGCVTAKSINISQPSALSVTPTSTSATCGIADGTASAVASGGVLPYNYLWSNGATISPTTQLLAGIYSVTVSDLNGCSKSASVIVTNTGAPTVSIASITNVSCFGGSDGIIDLNVTGGAAPYSYSWQPIIPSFEPVTGLAAGNYQCNVMDSNGCVVIVLASVTQPSELIITTSKTSINNIGDSTGTATASVTGGSPTYTYQWSNGSTNITATGLPNGTYTVTVTDTKGCTKTGSAFIDAYPQLLVNLSATAINCFGDSATVTVSATGGSGVFIGTGSFIRAAGIYTFIVTDNANNSDSASITISQPSQLEATATPGTINCNGGNTAVIITATGGSGQYTGVGTYSANAGLKSYNVTDGNGCIANASATITQPAPLIVSTSATSISCFGGTSEVTITATGGTQPYSGTGTFTVTAGNFTFTVTDNNGCLASANIQINQPVPFVANVTSTPISCNGGTSIVSVTASGGTSPINGIGNFVLTAGTYNYVLTDQLGCTATTSITVTQPQAIVINQTQTEINCNGGSSIITISATGGTAPYIGTGTSTKLAGTYTATITDNTGCTKSLTYTVIQPTVLNAVASTSGIACKNGTAQVIVSATGGTPPYTGVGTFTVGPGTYSYLVTDAKGCTKSTTITITEPSLLTATATVFTPIACNGGSTNVTVAATGGTPPYTGTGLIPSTAGSKTFIVTDSKGCTASVTINISQPLEMTIAPSTLTMAKCFGDANGKVIVTVANGNGAQSYLWSTGSTTKTASNLIAGTYTFTVTDAIGCTNTSSFIITQPTQLTSTITGTNVSCFNGTNGTTAVVASGGTPPYTYLWNSGATTATNPNLANGTKNVTITDFSGCVTNNSIVLTQPAKLDYGIGSNNTNISCFGGNNASANVVIIGGVPPYTYVWNTSIVQTTDVAISLSAGTYTVTVSDVNSCTITRSYTVTQPLSAISGTITVANVLCSGGSNGSVTANPAGGTSPYSYLWSNNITTKINNTIVAGTYTVTVTDNKGCTFSMSNTISQPSLINHNETITPITCFGGTGGISLTPSGGTSPYTYSWNGGVTTASRSGLTVNSYIATITDANGCTRSKTIVLTQPTAVIANTFSSNVSCNGSGNGLAGGPASGGIPPYTYLWSGGNTNVLRTGLTTGTYTVTVTDANSCTATRSYTITQPTILSGANTSSSLGCYNSTNGSVTANPSGGTSPYTYLWSIGTTTKTAATLAAGIYTVTVTDSRGCTYSASNTLTLPPLLYSTFSLTNTTCATCTNGSISLTAFGGNTPYSYLWNNSTTTKNRTGLAAGNYTLTISDNKGCTEIRTYRINAPGTLNIAYTTNNLTCGGIATGTINTTVTGGTTPYSYLWNTGQTTANRTGLSAGTYTVTVTDGVGSARTQNFTLVQPTPLTVNTNEKDVTCNGAANGIISAAAAAGTPGYTYIWNTGTTTSTITNRLPGTYTVTVTDASGCTATRSDIVSQPAVLSLTKVVANASCNGSYSGSITNTISGGNSPYSYIWSNGNTVISPTGLSAGSYTVTVTDKKGCSTTSATIITQPNSLTVSTALTNVNCSGGNSGSATATPTGGTSPYSYSWNTSPVKTTSTASGLIAGTYTVTVTDNNGCTATASVLLTQPNTLTTTLTTSVLTCNGSSNGSASITASGGTTPYLYLWSNGNTTTGIINLSSNSYTITVTDNKGCTAVKTAVITQPSLILFNSVINNVSCFGGNNGSITTAVSGGSAPYAYLWNNGNTNAIRSNLNAGNYTLTVTDNVGCTRSNTISVGTNPSLILTLSKTNTGCSVTNNGTATVTVSGGTSPYVYSWNTNPIRTTSSITNLTAGTYTVTVTDNLGCSSTGSISVITPSNITATISSTSISCSSGFGTATITPTTGTAPFSYNWSNGTTSATATGLLAGVYTATVTDANGCSTNNTITINGAAVLTVTVSINNVTCFGLTNGSTTATVAGGTAPFTFLWSNGSSTSTIDNLAAATYTVTVTDTNGCSATANNIVSQPAAITITGVKTNVTCFGSNNGTVTHTITGGTAPYTALWSNGSTTISLTNLAAGTYTTTITDANGCTSTKSCSITEPVAMTLSLTSNDVTCNGLANGVATAFPASGTIPYTYLWSNGSTNKINSNVAGGSYTVTVTDANGCTITGSIVVDEYAPLTLATTSLTNVTCFGLSNGAITTNAVGGKNPYTYLWSNGNTTKTVTGLAAGSYTVTTTDNKGCLAQLTYTISQPDQIVISTSVTNVSTQGGNDGSATATVSGGIAPHIFSWNTNPVQTNATATGLTAGNYTIIVTDVNGCTMSASVTVVESCSINVMLSQTNVSCFGLNNGSVTANATSGLAPFTYLWSNGATTSTINSLIAGNYTVTVTDVNLCSSVTNASLLQPAQLIANTSATNITCFGLANGAVTATATGGTAPYTYLWSDGNTTVSIANVTTGNYTVTVSDASGCTITVFASISQPDTISINGVATNATCFGTANGTIPHTISGGTAPYSCLWSNGATTISLNNLAAGVYTTTIADANGCASTKSVTITEPVAMTLSLTSNDVTCNGLANGVATAFPASGTIPYTYLWSNGSTNKINSNVAGGSYTVTVTDANGCTITGSIVVDEYAPLTLATTSLTNVTCFGLSNGAITTNAVGGKNPYTYLWSNGNTTKTVTGLAAGSYTVTTTDNKGCLAQLTYTISQPDQIVISTSVTNVSTQGGNDGSATATVSGGIAPHIFSWNTNPVQTNATATGLTAGNYTIIVTDVNGCTMSASVTVVESCSINVMLSQTNVSCFGLNNGSVTANATSGLAPFTYLWSNGATTSTINSLIAGNYTVTVTDVNLCSSVTNASLLQPAQLIANTSATNITCFGLANGAVTATATGGTAPYTYLWSDGNTTVSIANVTTGNYTVTVSDASGCTITVFASISQPDTISINGVATNATCFGTANGTIPHTISGGTAPYSCLWSNGATTISLNNLAAGVYTTTIADANGCASTKSVTITEPVAMTLSLTSNDVTCNGLANGVATAFPASGTIPYTYLWSNGSTNKINSNVAGGSYTVTVTDANGCTITGSIVVDEYAPLTLATTSLTNVTCFGLSNGAITTNAVGGKNPYTYLWSNGNTTKTVTGLAAGSYTVTTTDNKGCLAQLTYTISQPDQIVISTSVTNVSTQGGNDGSATATVSGGIAPHIFSWNTNPVQTNATATGLTAGNYTIIVTDVNGCTMSASVTVVESCSINVMLSQTNVSCFGLNNGSVTANATSGLAPFTYLWSNGATTSTINSLIAGNYTVTVTDVNLCSTAVNVQIIQPAQLVVNTTKVDVTCFGLTNGSATATVAGGTAPFTFLWSNGSSTSTIDNLAAATYTVTVTDANGCSAAANSIVSQPAAITITGVKTNVTCFGSNNGSASVTVTGGLTPYSYLWSNGNTTFSITGLTAATYTVTVSSANGCTQSTLLEVNQPQLLSASISQTNVSCFGLSNGSLLATVSGGVSPYNYFWSNGNTNAAVTGLVAGSYNLTVTDANGCLTTVNAILTQPLVLVVSVSKTNITCVGAANGTITNTTSGGTLPYSYLWSNGFTASNLSGLNVGTYTVTVTDANGCSGTTATSITQSAIALGLSLTNNDVTCNGLANGKATAFPTNGSIPYTYLWSNGRTDKINLNIAGGTYTVTVTDFNGCTITGTTIVTEYAALGIATVSQTNVTCNGGNNGSVSQNSVGGKSPYTFVWNTGSTLRNQTTLAAGTYTTTITDNKGCTFSKSYTITQPSPINVPVTSTNLSAPGANNGTATASANGGIAPYSYSWNTNPIRTTATITGLASGIYTVTATDANACTKTASVTIIVGCSINCSISKNNVTCNGLNNGNATAVAANGTGPYNYTWSNGATTATNNNLAAGTYTVTATDANGCSVITAVVIEQPVALNGLISGSNPSCFGSTNGTATIAVSGGNSPYSYNWSNGATVTNIASLASANYTVIVADANGCSLTRTIFINQPTALVVDGTKQDVTCNGGNNGAVLNTTIGGTIPYTYLWSNGITAANLSNLIVGTYTLTVTDLNGCSGQKTFVVNQPQEKVLTMTSTEVTCSGYANGTATVNVTNGGTPPFTYLWSNGLTSQTISNLNGGNYTVTVTGALGCIKSGNISVVEYAPLTVQTLGLFNETCYGGNDGGLITDASGGKQPYTFLWSNGSTTKNISAIFAGSYTLTVTDNNNCSVQQTYTINEPAPLVITITKTNVTGPGNNGTAKATATGGNNFYSYYWDVTPPVFTDSVSGLAAGTYTVLVTDISGCTQTASVTITGTCALSLSSAITNVTCNGLSNGIATVNASGGNAPYSYLWSNGQTNVTATGLTVGNYTVSVTASNQCTGTLTVSISQPIALTSAISASNVSCFGLTNGNATLLVSGGTAPYTYLWNNGNTTNIATGLAIGSYTVTATDANGCSTLKSITITQPSSLLITSSKVNAACFGTATGSISNIISGGTSPYIYLWSNGVTTLNAINLIANTYTVTVTDNNGCSATALQTISQPAVLATTLTSNDVSCNGLADGKATAFPTGGTTPYAYIWNNGSATKINSNLAGGNYTVTVTDSRGCTTAGSILVTEYLPLVLSTTSQTNVSCFGGSNGAINNAATGGKSPYTYLWSNGSTVRLQSTFTAGTYTCTVTDNKGCLAAKSYTITQPAVINITINSTNVTTLGGSNGTAAAVVTGGTGSYTYSWNTAPVKTTASVTGLVAGTYTVTVTDAKACSATKSVTITQPGARITSSSFSSATLNATVFPNPTNDEVTISFNEIVYTSVAIDIYNTTGEKLFSSSILTNDNQVKLNLDSFAKGVYVIKYKANDKLFIDRLIIN